MTNVTTELLSFRLKEAPLSWDGTLHYNSESDMVWAVLYGRQN